MGINSSKFVLALYGLVLVLLPFARLVELPILILSIVGIYALIKNWLGLKNNPQFKILSVVFLSYLAMVLISAPDSYWQTKTLTVALASLRFYFSAIAMLVYVKHKDFRWMFKFVSFYVLLLSFDALVQFYFGTDLIGRGSYPGRLNGVFGENHVKLGPVLALLLPIAMIALRQQKSVLRWLITVMIIIVIILSGTRSAWIMMVFTLVAYWFHHVKYRRIQLLLKATAIASAIVVSLWFVSSDFQQRIKRSFALFDGTQTSIDFALADRLPIWKASLNMIKSHPINGIGAHGFRKAYAEYAETNDNSKKQTGMHAHHWLLEILAETGIIGLLVFLYASIKLFSFVKNHYHPHYSWAFMVALISAFLPVASLYSMFASFWSICLWFVGIGLIMVAQKSEAKDD